MTATHTPTATPTMRHSHADGYRHRGGNGHPHADGDAADRHDDEHSDSDEHRNADYDRNAAGPEGVSPLACCVALNTDGTYTAYLGYNNPNKSAVVVPMGARNRFYPAPANRGQPTVFLPGVHHSAFTMKWDGKLVQWNLDGFTANLSKDSPACSTATPTRIPPELPTPVCESGAEVTWKDGGATGTTRRTACPTSTSDRVSGRMRRLTNGLDAAVAAANALWYYDSR